METGTGKTYVYLRTIYELASRYPFRKFIIVVPTVAIREGVLKNLEITRDHLRSHYDNLALNHFVYDSKNPGQLRQFGTSNLPQIMIINIDAFRKNFTGTEDDRKSNLMYRETNRLSGNAPIDFSLATPVHLAVFRHPSQPLQSFISA